MYARTGFWRHCSVFKELLPDVEEVCAVVHTAVQPDRDRRADTHFLLDCGATTLEGAA